MRFSWLVVTGASLAAVSGARGTAFNEKLVNTGAGEAWAEPEVKEIGGEKGG